MAILYPTLENIKRLKVQPTIGEEYLIAYLIENLDDSYEVFFNPFLDGDRPDFIIVKEGVAIFIIEVKDYNLDKYRVDSFNKWFVTGSHRSSRIASPQSQAFSYKKNLYQLHLPVLGLSQLTNRNFFNLVSPFVYLHNSSKDQVNQFYQKAESELRTKSQELFKNHKQKKLNHDLYNKQSDVTSRNLKRISRDKAMIYPKDKLEQLISKIKSYTSHILFDGRIYDDFKRRLMPCEHTLKQGKSIPLDIKQSKLAISEPVKEKITGVAGCGKTTIIANRAVSANARHESRVLIISFNITLKNLIKDRISDVLGYRDEEKYGVTNYHQFYNSQINQTGQDISELISRHGLDGLYKRNCFEGFVLNRYSTILIDEVQDFESDWVKILRDNFLKPEGEMVLFSDKSQNIYERDNERAAVIAQGFGSWKKLNKSYRTSLDSPLNQVFKEFQSQYLIGKYTDSELLETEAFQPGLSLDVLAYHLCSRDKWEVEAFDLIQKTIRSNNFNPNDVVILSSNLYLVRKLVEKYKNIEKTHCMFESYEELYQLLSTYEPNLSLENLKAMKERELRKTIYKYDNLNSEIDRVRRAKKNHFYANSGLIKLSTVHSFKGLESKTVFYLLDDKDTAEIVYTSITRSIENLIILDISEKSQFSVFFKNNMNK
jgi:hypothetical protein